MTDRPILRFRNPRAIGRRPSGSRMVPKSLGLMPTIWRQGERLRARFDPIVAAFLGNAPTTELRRHPNGIAPERALVFETATPIQDFARVAREAGLDILAETESEAPAQVDPADFASSDPDFAIYSTLYATMPTERSLQALQRHWRAYQNGQAAPEGLAPWWRLFETLIDLRSWGPDDRLGRDARRILKERMPLDPEDEVNIEIEIWPSPKSELRERWATDAEAAVIAAGGRVIDRAALGFDGFVYTALLVGLRAGNVAELIENPALEGGLAKLEGVQFILPQTVGQAIPPDSGKDLSEQRALDAPYDPSLPHRAVLLDGVPTAGHLLLNGGVDIEDVHDLVRVSQVSERRHATAMASLILRGDLDADGTPLKDSRLLSVPILVDTERDASSPPDRLFLNVVHSALAHCFFGSEALAPNAFVVNFSVGVREARFGGRVSSIARLLDWWSWRHGVLFVVSAGNIGDEVSIEELTTSAFEDLPPEERSAAIRAAVANRLFERTLLAPAEALNVLTVGALSEDLSP